MSSIPAFVNNMTKLSAAVTHNADLAVKAAARSVTKKVIEGTPVDTGKARSNWQVSLGSPRNTVLTPYAPGRHLGKGEATNAAAAFQKAAGTIAGRRRGQVVIIQNNVGYIGRLNKGSSKQAPTNFVESAVFAGLKSVRGIRILKVR